MVKNEIRDMNSAEMENHEVVTEDGYILTMHRIPRRKDIEDGLEDNHQRPPVLICHGLVCQGSHWLMNTEDKCLPHILNTAGYDTWLANFRGTLPSKRHKILDKKSPEFWDFSYDQMARYDLPAMMDYILKTTGSLQLFYVGHSMGCLIFFTSMSIYPENCQKVGKMVALAPSVYGRNLSNWFIKFGILCGSSVSTIRNLYCRQVPLLREGTVSAHLRPICVPFAVTPDQIGAWIISTLFVRFGMFGREQIEPSRLLSISQQWPSTTSLKTIFHMSQLYSSEVRAYDYGTAENVLKYNAEAPPAYDLGLVNVPVVLFSSEGDELCATNDIKQAAKDLPNVIDHIEINDVNFSHMDFMAGKDADELVFLKIVDVFGGRRFFKQKNLEQNAMQISRSSLMKW